MDANDVVKLGFGYGGVFSLATTLVIACVLWLGVIKLKDKKQISKLLYLTSIPLIAVVVGFASGWMRLGSIAIEEGIRLKALTDAQVATTPPYIGDGYRGILRPPMEAYLQAFVVPVDSKAATELKNLLAMIDERRYPEEPLEFFNADEEFRAKVEVFRQRMRTFIASGNWPEK
jgi:hypothetical protein